MNPTASTVPPYISPAQVGKACGVTKKVARALLLGAGILVRIGGRWYAGESQLRERLPEVYDRVYAWFVLAGPKVPGSAQACPKVPGVSDLIEGEG